MLGATAVAVLTFPLAVSVLVVADLVRGRFRLPAARVYLFALQYLINDSVEILLAGPYWLMAGFGTRLRSPASIERHRRLQQWSIDLLERRAEQLLGLRVEMTSEDHRALDGTGDDGPVIVVSRHVSLFDASLPGVVCHRAGYATRGIIMAELLADPGFDLIYGRLGSVFIPRDDGEAARRAIAAMVDSAEGRTAYVLFPEGRLFRPSVRDRALERLSSSDPDRGERLRVLEHVLPPRPGGLLTILDAVPEADVVVLDHRGLDRHRRLADLVAAAPVADPVTVTARRIPRSEVPSEAAGRVRWLDDLWIQLDRSLRDHPGGSE